MLPSRSITTALALHAAAALAPTPRAAPAARRAPRRPATVFRAADGDAEEKPMTLYDFPEGQPIMNRYSSMLTRNKKQGASQAMLYATGLQPEDMPKAQVGVGSIWYDGRAPASATRPGGRGASGSRDNDAPPSRGDAAGTSRGDGSRRRRGH